MHSIIGAMQELPANIYSVAAVRDIERRAIDSGDVTGYQLMCRAGAAALQAARCRFPDAARWQVLAGGGNNGGDGYVVARLAAQQGLGVSVLALIDPETLSGAAAEAHADFIANGGAVLPWGGQLDIDADLLLDALLGSGLERDVAGEFAVAVAAVNAHPASVHALDIPTGIHGDSGEVLGCAIVAELTTTFVGLKAGLFLNAGPDTCGEIGFAGLEIENSCRDGVDVAFRRVDDATMTATLAPRARAAHKGDFGHVLVVGGGVGMPGAALLCGAAALRTGAGRVSIATHPSHGTSITANFPELMCHGVADASELKSLLESADVIAFGPGLGQSAWAAELFAALQSDSRPAVWDADALNLLASQPTKLAGRIITPHPGEAARLLATSAAAIQSDRPAALANLVSKTGATTVLKGAGTLVSTASGPPILCTNGNPGMAAPGMGDVLTGVIAALMAQGHSATTAASISVEVHARAGDRAARGGERGLTASDVIGQLRAVVNP